MADNNDWTPAIGCRKAAIQIAVRLPLALAVAWGGFWVLQKFVGWTESATQQENASVDGIIIFLIAIVAGALAGQILSRKLSEDTGLFGTPLLAATCIPFLVGMWIFQQIVGSSYPEWVHVTFWLFSETAIAGSVMAWWQFGLDS
ncbi:MAG: hypothetical protein HN350_02210 [Phycisphaerales bacterium]|jgi:hypothetical protein|nr:hypothetical protein [Phycisphaerales bacterium]